MGTSIPTLNGTGQEHIREFAWGPAAQKGKETVKKAHAMGSLAAKKPNTGFHQLSRSLDGTW